MSKTCTKCDKQKPLEDFNKQKVSPDGHRSYCRSCQSELSKQYRLNKQQDIAWVESERKRHREAKAKLRQDEDYRNKQAEKEKLRRLKLKQDSDWVEAERKRSINKYYNDKAPYVANAAKRRAMKLQATPRWLTDYDWEMIKWTYECAKIAEKHYGNSYHVDHIVPLQGKNVCGLHVPWNLQVISAKQNLTKGNRYESY